MRKILGKQSIAKLLVPIQFAKFYDGLGFRGWKKYYTIQKFSSTVASN